MGVQAMCLSGGSSSPSLRSVSIASFPEPAPSLPSSADLSSRRASWDNGRFPLAVPWWCCSTESPDLGDSGNQQHDVQLDDARGPRQRAENSTSPGRVSRAVSTCSIFSHLGEVNDPGKDTCVSSGSQGDCPMSSGSCDCCCEALENPYHEACRWSNALRPHSDLFGHRDVQLMFHADSGRACANEAMPGRDSRSPPCGHQHCCRCLCLTSGSGSGWRRPLRRAVSHDVPGCGNSRLLTGCPCQNASRQFHLDACINGCPSPGVSPDGGVDGAGPLSPTTRPWPCHSCHVAWNVRCPHEVFSSPAVHTAADGLKCCRWSDTPFPGDQHPPCVSQCCRSRAAVPESLGELSVAVSPASLCEPASAAKSGEVSQHDAKGCLISLPDAKDWVVSDAHGKGCVVSDPHDKGCGESA